MVGAGGSLIVRKLLARSWSRFHQSLFFNSVGYVLNIDHSGGEGRLGEKKYIIGVSYTVGKVWASPFGIS